ncbi:hypothetical protein FOL47_005819 [Perkinsus chesapeaki]|uniref:PH domain-containing protein n=1 Tax=Perkinsus chesapeaki TaxID=330153 RepID=A0A7J6LVW1_PERCH|nr:hypothetical protein FOL47_005819 [Perkinsus chesapeaki]
MESSSNGGNTKLGGSFEKVGMSGDTVRVHFIDNTYRDIRNLSPDTTVSELLFKLQQKDSKAGRMNIYFVASGRIGVYERKLEESEKPLNVFHEGTTGKLVVHSPGEKLTSKISFVDQPESARGDVLRRGWLDKLSSDGKKWKPRIFTLRSNTLTYGAEGRPERTLDLVNCEKVVAGDGRSDAGESKRIFRVVMDTRTLTLRATTAADRDMWVLSVAKSAAILKENKILEQASVAMRENNKRKMNSEIKGLFSLTQSVDSLLSFSCEARDVFLSHTIDCVESSQEAEGEDIDYQGVRDYVMGYGEPGLRERIGEKEFDKIDGYSSIPNVNNKFDGCRSVVHAKRYPFTASKKNGLSINDRIRRGEYSFNKMEDVCPKAKDLISRLIVVDPAKRITLEDALHHPWLADFPLAVKLAHTWTPTMPQTLVAELPGILSTKSSVVMPSAVEEDLSPIASEDGSVREYPVGVKIVDGGKCELPTIRSKDSAKRELLRPNADDGFGAKAAEKLRLDELCSAQMSACDLLRQVYFLLQDKPLVQDKVGAFILDARQLRHSTTAIMGRCADIAEVVETDISDMTLFVEEGVPECAVDCMASVNSKLVGMTESCEELQQGHARLAARMQKIISVLPGAASRLSQKQLQAISYYENELLDGASTDKSAQTLALLFDQLGNVSEGGSPLDSSSDIADVYDLPFLAAGHVVSKRAGSADTTTTTTSVSSEADSSTESSFGSSSSSSADPTRLVARSLAKLRRVDEILSRMSNFWASVDQSVAKLSDMRENTERLLRGATKSDRILNLFKSRAVEYQTFWREFGQSCRRYAEVMSQGSQKLTEPLEVTNLPEAASPISGRLPALNEQEA